MHHVPRWVSGGWTERGYRVTSEQEGRLWGVPPPAEVAAPRMHTRSVGMVKELARPAPALRRGTAPEHAWAYLDGEFVPIRDAKVSVMTHAFNYGTGVFEGIRAYWNAEDEQLY